MPRFKLTLEYDGRPFVGWQRQENGLSVQAVLEQAAGMLCGGTPLAVTGSGRTDAGVHARGQVAHLDLPRAIDAHTVQGALNYHLKPHPVAVLAAEETAADFHARFSATARHYRYRIVNRRAPLTFDRGLAWHVIVPLDADAMHDAAQALVGRHDFTTFRHSQCQAKSPVKTLDYIRVTRDGEDIRLETGARSFLHHQVRSITGTLKLVGEGKWTRRDLRHALDARDRAALGLNAPPDGLYFMKVEY